MIKEIIKKIVGKFDFKNKKILKECVVMKNEVSSYTNRELSWLQFNERVLNTPFEHGTKPIFFFPFDVDKRTYAVRCCQNRIKQEYG